MASRSRAPVALHCLMVLRAALVVDGRAIPLVRADLSIASEGLGITSAGQREAHGQPNHDDPTETVKPNKRLGPRLEP